MTAQNTAPISFVFRLLWLLFGVGLTLLALGLWLWDYETASVELLRYLQREAWADYWRERIMPPARYAFLRYLLSATALFFWLLLPLCWRKIEKKTQEWSIEWAAWREKLQFWRLPWSAEPAFLRGALYVLTLIFVLRTIANWWYWELQYDEAWSYLHFVEHGAVVSAVSPHNNHILYTVLASWAQYLPFLGDKYALRLPLLLGGLLLWVIWIGAFWRWRGGYWALAMGLALLSAPVLQLYMVFARGYVFMLAALAGQIVGGAWYWQAAREGNGEGGRLAGRLWWFSVVWGLYSVPTYIYYYLLLSVLWVLVALYYRRWALLSWDWVWLQIKAAAVVLFLYAPFLLAGGGGILWRAAAEGAASENRGWAGSWAWYDKWADWLVAGLDFVGLGWGLLLLGALFLWAAFKGGERWAWVWLVLAGLLLMPLFVGAGQPLRVFAPSALAVVVGLGLLLVRLRWWGLLPVSTLLLLSAYRHYELRWSAPLDRAAVAISALLCAEGVKEIYCFSRYDKPLLEYYGLRRCEGRKWRVYMPFEESRDYLPLRSRAHYEAVLLDTDDYAPSAEDWAHVNQAGYRLLYSDYRLRLYVFR